MSDALLIIDMQNYFFRTEARKRKIKRLAAGINRLIEIFEGAGLPVYHVLTVHKPDGSTWDRQMLKTGKAVLIENTDEAHILKDIRVSKLHKRIEKTRHSAFLRTGIEEQLKKSGITRLTICGVYTHGCVGRTAIDAKELDFDVLIAKDAIYSHRKILAYIMLDQLKKAYDIKLLTGSEFNERLLNG